MRFSLKVCGLLFLGLLSYSISNFLVSSRNAGAVTIAPRVGGEERIKRYSETPNRVAPNTNTAATNAEGTLQSLEVAAQGDMLAVAGTAYLKNYKLPTRDLVWVVRILSGERDNHVVEQEWRYDHQSFPFPPQTVLTPSFVDILQVDNLAPGEYWVELALGFKDGDPNMTTGKVRVNF